MKKKALISVSVSLIIISVLLLAKGTDEKETLILATTTSTYDSGLLDYMLPDFEEEYDIRVHIISVGTGQALKNGERGDVDVILVHAPDDEKEFVAKGFGVNRECVMYNDFVILGPKNDPAQIKEMKVEDALRKISENNIEFISRGDDSGTHKKEMKIWEQASVKPKGGWYKDVGAGMGNTIRIANEKLAYTISDRGTYLSLKDKIELVPLVEGDNILINQYGIIAVNQDKHPHVNYDGANKLVSWFLKNSTQLKIDSYKKNDEQLFFSTKGECVGD